MKNEEFDIPSRKRVATFKSAIAARLYEIMEDDRATDGPIALAALAELTAEFGCMLVGKRITIEMFSELSRRVLAAKDGSGIAG